MTDLLGQQLELVAELAAFKPAVSFMGGFAEDAVLAGTVTRPHEDVDLIFPRDQQELRLAQLAGLGFTEWETWGEASPGAPFYLFGQRGDLKIDLGITDEVDGAIWVRVGRLAFTVGGKEAPAGYQLRLPDDLFDQRQIELDGIPIKPISALAMYQLRAGVARMNSFGPLSDRHLATLVALRERFFPDRSEEELLPACEPLPDWPPGRPGPGRTTESPLSGAL
jgi:hypothetical protein